MKLKLLTLFLTLGLFAFGSGVNATSSKEPDSSGVSDEKVKAAVDYVKSNAQSGDAISVACKALEIMGAPCSPCGTFPDLGRCVAQDQTFAKPIGIFCDKVCGGFTCKVPTVAKVCQAVCCAWDANHSEVKK